MLGLALAMVACTATLALLLCWAARTPGAAELAGWAARYDLELHREDRQWVASELRRGRLLRTLAFVVTLAIGGGASFWWAAKHQVPSAPFPLDVLSHPAAWATGYLVGATAAELTRRRPSPQPIRTAALVPRRLGDYVPAWMLWIERGVALAALALALVGSPAVTGASPMTDHPLARGIAAIAIAMVVEVALRYMVRRPQPVASSSELVVDDALRPTAIHRTAGAGLAALLFLLGRQFAGLVGQWWALDGLAYLVCYGLAIGAWKDLSVPMRWPIRRARAAGRSGGPPVPRHDPGRGPA